MIVLLVDALLFLVAVALLIPAIVICVECVAALLPPRRRGDGRAMPRPRVTVIVPAHNEASIIAACLASVRAQLEVGDRLLVIADNCDDATVVVAHACGAQVIERRDPHRRGKGYALDVGLTAARLDPPEVVIMIDADCAVADETIDHIARLAAATGRPVQAAYLIEPSADAGLNDYASSFAFTLKNLVRPRGSDRLGLPCSLMGTGMAFPWTVIRDAALATPKTAEDLRLTVQLARAGHMPVFCGTAKVTGRLLRQKDEAHAQRTRWEHGHLETLITEGRNMWYTAIQRRSVALAAMALDLCVPPLALFVTLLATALGAALLAAAMGASAIPAALLVLGGLVLSASVGVAWLKFGRDSIPLRMLFASPLYVLRKMPLYFAFFTRRQSTWAAADPNSAERHVDAPTEIPVVHVGAVTLHALTEAQCVSTVCEQLAAGRGGWIVTINVDHLRLFAQEPQYAVACAAATLVVADGMPLVWASRLQGTPLPERVTGIDLVSSLSAAAAACGRSIFLLGGAPGTAEAAAGVLRRRYPELRIAGTVCPPFGFEGDPEATARVTATVCAAAPDIVYVALGKPKQDMVINRLRDQLPRTWFLGVGIAFSFLSGDLRRAPVWMQHAGLEWLHRLMQEPRRLARRYVFEAVPVTCVLLATAAVRRIRRRPQAFIA